MQVHTMLETFLSSPEKSLKQIHFQKVMKG